VRAAPRARRDEAVRNREPLDDGVLVLSRLEDERAPGMLAVDDRAVPPGFRQHGDAFPVEINLAIERTRVGSRRDENCVARARSGDSFHDRRVVARAAHIDVNDRGGGEAGRNGQHEGYYREAAFHDGYLARAVTTRGRDAAT
jgi:hypothetical protein